MKGAMDNLMKHAQRMQQDLQRAQEEIARLEVTGEAGAGLVKVVMTGRRDVRRVHIDPSLPLDDRGMLEDLIAAAMNDANRRIERATQERLGALTSGLGLPPGMKLPL